MARYERRGLCNASDFGRRYCGVRGLSISDGRRVKAEVVATGSTVVVIVLVAALLAALVVVATIWVERRP